MILVIGGSFQGKKAYAAQICGGGTVLADFQDRIRAALEAGEDPEAFTRQILVNPPAVITLDEVGLRHCPYGEVRAGLPRGRGPCRTRC